MTDAGATEDIGALERRDAAARGRALDAGQSFLVQAPAGSGKTGLLIQRYLALLAHVDRPERIVAMTFTRKAATEMRDRVLQALRDARDGAPIDSGRLHASVTRELAVAALEQDGHRDWQLIAQPSRLRILTIDALAAALARRAPVASGLGALPTFVDDASALYVRAVRTALAAAAPDDRAWRAFLARIDNDADRAVDLLASMLARRDQWLRLPLGVDRADLRRELEAALRAEIDAVLSRVRAEVPAWFLQRVVAMMRYAAACFAQTPGSEALAAKLESLVAHGGLPPPDADHLTAWQTFVDFVLTKDGSAPSFRKQVDARHGFPPKGKEPGCMERVAAKQAMAALLADARTIPGLAESLHMVRTLPPPVYGDASWSFVAATLALMPQIAAHLLTVFAAEGAADFGEATLRALAALGDTDDPGQLLLAVDYQLQHLLVDEFQDTSWTHRDLIHRLTSGWQPGDGRTLFAVGDPMQSIYRFREAEVGIFLAAQTTSRVAGVAVECLELARNFRSARPVVDWINAVFPFVLPPRSDASRGEVAYKPVLATHGDASDAPPTLDIVASRDDEAQAVVRAVRTALESGSTDVAVLVQARRHLDAILPALRRSALGYAAIDLETLAERLATRDLITLTRAMTQPADQLASLALLRAPWCGLTLADLLIVAQAATSRHVMDVIADEHVASLLSADGRARAARVRASLYEPMVQRGRIALSRRVRAAWLALGGPATGDGDIDAAGAERFFELLTRHERGGDIDDWESFVAATGKLFAAPQIDAAHVQVMTLHRAKGLEFDTVILPGLDRPMGRSDEPALRWRQREHGDEVAMLLAPLRAREGAVSAPDPVYQYLGALDATEARAERGRLLYVGCTRAKRRLHLVAVGRPNVDGDAAMPWRAPPKGSALAQLWPVMRGEQSPSLATAAAGGDAVSDSESRAEDGRDDDAAVPVAAPLRSLSLDWKLPDATNVPTGIVTPVAGADEDIAFDWARAAAAAIGTVAHRILAQIAADGIAAWSIGRVEHERGRIDLELAQEGVPRALRPDAVKRVAAALIHTLTDVRGRWLFDADHQHARSEWPLAGFDEGILRHVSIDRTFVTDDERWIIDFKTSTHEGGGTAAFLDSERERYRPQLEAYARIVRQLDSRPIRLALYFPLITHGWREWPSAS